MNKRVQYQTQEERERLILENKDLRLILEVCSVEGNYLTFSNDVGMNERISNIEESIKLLTKPEEEKIQKAIDMAVLEMLERGI